MNNQQTPGKYDAVLGGENQPSEGAAVLGGIEGYDSEDVANYLDAQEDEDGDYSSRTNLAEHHKHLFDTAVAQIEEAFNAGELTEQQAIALEINAIGELRDRLSDENIDYICEELGYDPEEVANYLDAQEYEHDEEDDDDEYEEVNYSSGTNLADFQAGNAFGFHLTTLLLGKGYKDIESDMVEFTSVLGLTGEEVAGLITGDYVPAEETVAKLAEFFQLDDDQIDTLASSAYEAWEEAGYEIEETGLLHDEEKEYNGY